MRRLFTSWSFWLLLILIVPASVLSTRKEFHNHLLDRQAERWASLARTAATDSTFSPDQAAMWLKKNGFTDLGKGSRHSSGQGVEEDYSLVGGSLELSGRAFLQEPAWLELHFKFTPDEKKFIEVDVRRHKSP